MKTNNISMPIGLFRSKFLQKFFQLEMLQKLLLQFGKKYASNTSSTYNIFINYTSPLGTNSSVGIKFLTGCPFITSHDKKGEGVTKKGQSVTWWRAELLQTWRHIQNCRNSIIETLCTPSPYLYQKNSNKYQHSSNFIVNQFRYYTINNINIYLRIFL